MAAHPRTPTLPTTRGCSNESSASAGDDVLRDPAPGDRDSLFGGDGDDKINVADNDDDDTVHCGAGRDEVKADRGDRVDPSCEGA